MKIRWFILFFLMTATGPAEEWNRFRGPNGSGISDATGLPVEFGRAKNIDWRTEIPFGRSSPILARDCVVVTGSEGEKLITVCIDRKTGRVAWRRELLRDRTQEIYKDNDTATPTPASDGENIYVFFADLGLVSYGPGGEERWRFKLGPFHNFYGISASPVVYGDTLVQVCDSRRGSFIIALDKDSGSVRWRKERPMAKTEAYSTPILWMPEGGKAQVVVVGAYRIDGYALDSGQNLWWVGGQGTSPISSPVLDNGILFATSHGADKPQLEPWAQLSRRDKDKDGRISALEIGEYNMLGDHFGWLDRNEDGFLTQNEWNEVLEESVSEHGLAAVRAGGSGDMTRKNLLWRSRKSYSDLTSPLLYRGVLYMVIDNGIVVSRDPETGEIWKIGRTKDAVESYYASPVAADGKVYLASHGGKISVLKAGPQWEVLSVNDLGEQCQATPAIGNGSIYIRTREALYRFSEKP
ncbi:MAG: PQQ-binding-like beta-propeller repeat protein [Acidobacteria bacterium]|nr:PQQ-binding-like beta-propeller repeat protein [Acidobacteriota bacterium]